MSFNLILTATDTPQKGGGGQDLLAMTILRLPAAGNLDGSGGDDLLLGYDGTDDDLVGGDDTDTLMGSFDLSIDLAFMAASGIFNIEALFRDDGVQDYMRGDGGDDWLVFGARDAASAGEGNDILDYRFATGASTFVYGDSGTDTVLARFAAGDSYVYDDNFASSVTGMTQRFTLASLGGNLFTDSVEVIQIANAIGPGSGGAYVHVIGSGDAFVGFNVTALSGQAVLVQPGVIDYALDGTLANDGFQIVGDQALIEVDDTGFYGFSVSVNGQPAQSHVTGVTLGAEDGLGIGAVTLSAEYGLLTVTYDAPDIPMAGLIGEIGSGQEFRLGEGRSDGYLVVTARYEAGTQAVIGDVLSGSVRTLVDLVRKTPQSLDLRGTGLTQAVHIRGSDAANLVIATEFADTLKGMAGDDTLSGRLGNDLIWGASGRDSLRGGHGDDTLLGGFDNDILIGDAGLDLLTGGHGDDHLFGGDAADTLNGGTGQDSLEGGKGRDSLAGGAGHDTLLGGQGNDTLRGDDGDDGLYGDTGDDILAGNTGDDFLDGGDGRDRLTGGAGTDVVSGGADNDRLFGNAGADILLGGDGHDRLYGGADDDLLVGDAAVGDGGQDTLFGGDGNDALFGGSGDDALFGGDGQDTLYGGDGINTLDGGLGDDELVASNTSEVLIGGAGVDSFSFGDMSQTDIYLSTIADFTLVADPGLSDRLDLSGTAYATLTIQQLRDAMSDVMTINGNDVHLSLDGNLLVFENTTTAVFNAYDHWLTT